MTGPASQLAEAAARRSYGRLVALLAARSSDVAGAEDALSEAFQAALQSWPRTGNPENPEAWLLTAARRAISHRVRHGRVEESALPRLQLALEEAQAKADESDSGFPDERLKLLFVCAHPAIDVASRAPLMLHCVLGVDPGRIASAFLVSPVSMRQRLVRAKARIKAVGIRFDVPEPLDWPERLDTVMDAIYAAYGTGWDGVAGADSRRKDLTGEAVWLGRALVELLPGEAEPRGLLSLMLHCEARARARRSPCGDYVPLDSQDTSLWDRALITEANAMLCTAPPTPTLGRFCCEAAIQAVHAERSATGVTNWQALVVLYDALARICPALGVLVSRAVCVAELEGARRGLTLLDELDRAAIARYQPYWAVRAHLAAAAGDDQAAAAAYEIAIGLSEDDSVRRFLIARARRAEELRPDMDRQRTPS